MMNEHSYAKERNVLLSLSLFYDYSWKVSFLLSLFRTHARALLSFPDVDSSFLFSMRCRCVCTLRCQRNLTASSMTELLGEKKWRRLALDDVIFSFSCLTRHSSNYWQNSYARRKTTRVYLQKTMSSTRNCSNMDTFGKCVTNGRNEEKKPTSHSERAASLNSITSVSFSSSCCKHRRAESEEKNEKKKLSRQINAETSACPNYQTVVSLSLVIVLNSRLMISFRSSLLLPHENTQPIDDCKRDCLEWKQN